MLTPEQARAKWVAALRSGEYKQGKGQLATVKSDGTVEYCCLGVACELAIEDGVMVVVDAYPLDGIGPGSTYYNDEAAFLPEAVRVWLGLYTNTGMYVPVTGGRSTLAPRNDNGATFDKIADLIEKNEKSLTREIR